MFIVLTSAVNSLTGDKLIKSLKVSQTRVGTIFITRKCMITIFFTKCTGSLDG